MAPNRLKIALVNPPYRSPTRPDTWITVPPEGYGGVQWVLANLIDGLRALGHEIHLLGAPDTVSRDPGLNVIHAAEPAEMRQWVRHTDLDIVHDHSNGIIGPEHVRLDTAYISTHHMTGRPMHPQNCVYLSRAQRSDAGATDGAPVVRIPINVGRYPAGSRKDDFLLFIGRVSSHKGTLEATAFAQAAGLPLLVAGPSWEPEYRAQVESVGKASVTFLGEVGGARRLDLLARARAVLALSQPVSGPWGGVWCEPGATVVSEAAASGTQVIATPNGCLAEIVPSVGRLVSYGSTFDPAVVREYVDNPVPPALLRSEAEAHWGHVRIASEYDSIYRALLNGAVWK